MSQPHRLPGRGQIDRGRTLRFTFDGRACAGHPGDTIASALLANGVHLMGRSFKYHRPRGVLGAGVEEPNALMGVTTGPGRFEPNARATCVPLADGMVVQSQNRSPSLARDIGAVNDLLSPFIPAGFYYKTFMWPRSFWARVYEPNIRRAAGLGLPPQAPDPDRYAQRFAHCETLIVGAGPAGLAAALAASQGEGRVILVEQDDRLGGMLRDEPDAMIEDMPAPLWIAQAQETLRTRGVRVLTGTTAFGYGIDNFVAMTQRCDGEPSRERLWLTRAGRVILATGAIERPLVFPNNDRPGIMLASAARAYLHRYGVLVGRRIVLATRHDSGWRAALDLAAAGAQVTIVDARPDVAHDLRGRADAAGVAVILDEAPVDSSGRLRVSRVAVSARAAGAPRRWLPCDALLMAGGWTPSIHLHSQSGGRPVWSADREAFLPGAARQNQESAGACQGSYALADCLREGWARGGGPGRAPFAVDRNDAGLGPSDPPQHEEGARRKAFVDFQNDVTAKDIRLAVREGFRSVEHLKRYTTNGMATDQGRTSNINALAIAAQTMGVAIEQAGLTTFRAPFTPVTFGTLAGHAHGALFEPVRTTPMHARAVAAGAVFEDVGQWKRAHHYPRGGEGMAAAVQRECAAVRAGVGLFDASTLGKIEVVGPDAAAFLDLIYTSRLSSLKVGRCRYGLMLREDGHIMDDGVVARLAPDRFHVTTTSGGAANVLAFMEDYRQTEWPALRLWLNATTEQWATMAVSGPQARALIAPLVEDIALAPDAMPHMSVREGRIAGVPLRLFRVSFTGELGYEVNVPARHGLHVWDALVSAGTPLGLTLYGTEASHVLRAEKGYIIVGLETDGTAIPDDVGLGRMVAMDKPDFLGKRSLMRPLAREAGRKQLVALLPQDGRPIDEGAQIVDPTHPQRSIGHVTSSYHSAALGRPFALAMVRGGRALIGTELMAVTSDASIRVALRDPVLYDPEGSRLHA